MGRRSRKRAVTPADAADHAAGRASRADRDLSHKQPGKPAAPRAYSRPGHSRAADRPPAPWGKFPLVELLVLLALVLLIVGIAMQRGPVILAGLAIGSLAGLELSIREHLSGFRSHTSLLAGAVTLIALAATYFATRGGHPGYVTLPVAGVVFLLAFWLLRQLFMRRSGGVGFRR